MSKIITQDDFQNYSSGISVDDALAQQIVDGVNAYIEKYTGRCFGEKKQVTERYGWTSQIWLRNGDVQTIDSVSLGWPGQQQSSVPATYYYFNPLGSLSFFGYFAGRMDSRYRDYVSVQYTYGYTGEGLDSSGQPAVPDDLKLAALQIAGGTYAWASEGNRNVSALSIGSYRVEYAQKRGANSTDPDKEASMSGNISWSIIDGYKLRSH